MKPKCEICRKETKELYSVITERGEILMCEDCSPPRFRRKKSEKKVTPAKYRRGGIF